MKIKNILEKAGLLLAGIIFTVLFNRISEKSIEPSEIGLTIAYVVFGLLIFLFVVHSVKRFNELINKLEISADYNEEDVYENKTYEGKIYKELKRQVNLAKKEIIAMDFTISESQPSELFQKKSRKIRFSYLKSIEKKVNSVRGFRYVRIHQIDSLSRNPDEYIKGLSYDHCLRLLTCKACKNKEAEVSIMKAKIKRLQSFLLIDQKTLLVEFDGTASDQGVYPFSVLTLEDKGDKVIKPIIRLINDVVQSGVPINTELLKTAPNRVAG
jgi:hypothetical protein